MKVLVLKPRMRCRETLFGAEYNRIVGEIKENKITVIDPDLFDYEIVDIDSVFTKTPKESYEPCNFDNTSITFKFIEDAKAARSYLVNMIRMYGCVTIADFEKYVKHPVGCHDKLYCWRNLKQEDIKIVHIYKYDSMACCYFDQFYLELPAPELIWED